VFRTDNYCAMATWNGERAKNTNVPGEMHEFRKMEGSLDNAGSMGDLLRTAELRGQLARFLHNHNDEQPAA